VPQRVRTEAQRWRPVQARFERYQNIVIYAYSVENAAFPRENGFSCRELMNLNGSAAWKVRRYKRTRQVLPYACAAGNARGYRWVTESAGEPSYPPARPPCARANAMY